MNNKYKIACLLALMSANSFAETVALDSSDFAVTASSEEKGGEGPVSGYITAAFDGDIATYWHSEWSNYEDPTFPYLIDIDLGGEYDVNKLDYLPRINKVGEGVIGDYEILVSTDGITYSSVTTGSWAATNDLLETTFTPTAASHVRIVIENAVRLSGPDDFVAAAEIRVYQEDYLAPDLGLKFDVDPANVTTSSEELTGEGAPNGHLVSAFDSDPTTFWHSEWSSYSGTTFPYTIDIDLGNIYAFSGFDYLPRSGDKGGYIADYELFVSLDGITYTSVITDTWADNEDLKTASFTSQAARWVRLVASSTASGNLDIASAAEFGVYVDSFTILPPKVSLDPTNFLVTTNSEELTGEGAPNGHLSSAFDDDLATFWHSEWSSYAGTTFPYEINVNLGNLYKLNAFGYTPSRDGLKGGNIGGYEIYVSQDGVTYTLATSGTWADDGTYKEASFDTQIASHIRLVALSTESGNLDIASAAEFDVFADSATPEAPAVELIKLDSVNFITYASSEELTGEGAPNGHLISAFDDDLETFWHSEWSSYEGTTFPYTIDVDLAGIYDVNAFGYTPRGNGKGGIIADYEILVSLDGVKFTKVSTGTWSDTEDAKEVTFSAQQARWVRLVALSTASGNLDIASAAEFAVFALSTESAAGEDVVSALDQTNFMPMVTSEEAGGEGAINGWLTAAFDNNEGTFWHTDWSSYDDSIVFPYTLLIDLGASYDVSKFEYATRGIDSGNIVKYELYLSNDACANFNLVESSGEWADTSDTKDVSFTPTLSRYVKLVMLEAGSYLNADKASILQHFASASEFKVYHTYDSLGDNPERTSIKDTTSACTFDVNVTGQAWVAEDGSIELKADETFEGQLPAVDADNAALTYSVVSGTHHGELAIDANGQYTYKPTLGYAGVDSFTFKATTVSDTSSEATITIAVKPALLVIVDPKMKSSGGSSSTPFIMFLGLLLTFRRFKNKKAVK
jgi:VCBS repeat-containing protein